MPIPSDLNLVLNQEAKARAASGADIINATIGMFFDDDGKLPIAPLFQKANYLKEPYFQYASIAGDPKFLGGIADWFFGKEAGRISNLRSISTPGGTGAVHLAIREATLDGFTFILPEVSWPNYFGILDLHGGDRVIVNNFRDGRMDLEAMEIAFHSAEKACLLINDPCHNPTGYTMSEEEWGRVVGLLNSKPEGAALILDLAYMNFSDSSAGKRIVDAISAVDKRIPVYLCFSFSKTFSAYGLRLGALSYLNVDEEKEKRMKKAARATWSNCNAMGMKLIGEAFIDPALKQTLRDWIEEKSKKNAVRASIFMGEAREVGLRTLPYHEGFFCTVMVKDAFASCMKLKEKDIFVVPASDTLLRIALCGIPTSKVVGLAKAIKEAE